MVTRSVKSPQLECPPTARTILRAWHADRSIGESSAQKYLEWITCFRRYCGWLGLRELDELTAEGAQRFKTWYLRTHPVKDSLVGNAITSLRALRRVYEVSEVPVPPWKPVERKTLPALSVLRDYAIHLAQHRGNPATTVHKKLDHVGKLLDHLTASGRSWRQMRLPDIDAFLIQCAHGYSRATTADIASTVRSFSRFLLSSGRVSVDLADAVISPVQPRFERPRRAWPWEDVQRLLRAVGLGVMGLGVRSQI